MGGQQLILRTCLYAYMPKEQTLYTTCQIHFCFLGISLAGLATFLPPEDRITQGPLFTTKPNSLKSQKHAKIL